MERGGDEHAQAQHARIVHFQPDFRRANIGIENRADVADPALQNPVRIGVQMDVGELAQRTYGQIVLIDIAEDPDVERSEMVKGLGELSSVLHARRGGDF